MGINTNALMHNTLEFLPNMLDRDSEYIINIASAAGLAANSKISDYCASNWITIGWSDSVRLEMKKIKKQLKITTVTPYYINTGMFDGVKSVIPTLKPDKAVRKIMRVIEKKCKFIRMPLIIYTLHLTIFDWFVGHVLGVYKTMDHFKGRK